MLPNVPLIVNNVMIHTSMKSSDIASTLIYTQPKYQLSQPAVYNQENIIRDRQNKLNIEDEI